MPPKCGPQVATARAQAEALLGEARTAIGALPELGAPRRTTTLPPGARAALCRPRLAEAEAALAAAGGTKGVMAQRDGYIRASFHAGQALACARATAVGKLAVGMPMPPTPKKLRKARATKAAQPKAAKAPAAKKPRAKKVKA